MTGEWAAKKTEGYLALKGFDKTVGKYGLSSIRMEDSTPIMNWRNSQISALRQSKPLTPVEQQAYFENIVRPQFTEEQPKQVLLRFTHQDKLIGYGGIVHLNWADCRGEVSFLLDPHRSTDELFYLEECKVFMGLLMECAFLVLRLNKISTEAYSHRKFHIQALESSGFTREGILREQTLVEGKWVDAVVASCLRSEYIEKMRREQE